MGRGSYTACDWNKLRASKSIDSQVRPTMLFKNEINKAFVDGAKGIRESRDSEDSPESTPVIIGFDVTSSMGYLAGELAKNSMDRLIRKILRSEAIKNPQILCSAIGDCKSDKNPLQVTQFESDIRIISELLDLHLEGGGGGNGGESYNLLWYFAANHTVADCFEKRGGKGFLVTVGDDNCHPDLRPSEIKFVFGDTVSYPISNEELLRGVQQKYNVIHIHIEDENMPNDKIFDKWQTLLPGRSSVIGKKDISYLADLILAMIKVCNKETVNDVLSEFDYETSRILARSMAFVSEADTEKQNVIAF